MASHNKTARPAVVKTTERRNGHDTAAAAAATAGGDVGYQPPKDLPPPPALAQGLPAVVRSPAATGRRQAAAGSAGQIIASARVDSSGKIVPLVAVAEEAAVVEVEALRSPRSRGQDCGSATSSAGNSDTKAPSAATTTKFCSSNPNAEDLASPLVVDDGDDNAAMPMVHVAENNSRRIKSRDSRGDGGDPSASTTGKKRSRTRTPVNAAGAANAGADGLDATAVQGGSEDVDAAMIKVDDAKDGSAPERVRSRGSRGGVGDPSTDTGKKRLRTRIPVSDSDARGAARAARAGADGLEATAHGDLGAPTTDVSTAGARGANNGLSRGAAVAAVAVPVAGDDASPDKKKKGNVPMREPSISPRSKDAEATTVGAKEVRESTGSRKALGVDNAKQGKGGSAALFGGGHGGEGHRDREGELRPAMVVPPWAIAPRVQDRGKRRSLSI